MDKYSTPKNKLSDPESPNNFKILTLMDPRSPTTAFQRTPLQVTLKNSRRIFKNDSVTSTPGIEIESSLLSFGSTSSILTNNEESFNSSRLDSCSFTSRNSYEVVDLLTTPSISINEKEIASNIITGIADTQNTISDVCYIKKISLKSEESETQYNGLEIVSPPENLQSCVKINMNHLDNIPVRDSIENEVMNKKLLKQHFLTPNEKRTPLSAVENLCAVISTPFMLESPQNMFREKEWKCIQVERKKLGIVLDENVQLPLYDVTASAPSNLTRRTRIQEKFRVHTGRLDF